MHCSPESVPVRSIAACSEPPQGHMGPPNMRITPPPPSPEETPRLGPPLRSTAATLLPWTTKTQMQEHRLTDSVPQSGPSDPSVPSSLGNCKPATTACLDMRLCARTCCDGLTRGPHPHQKGKKPKAQKAAFCRVS